MRCICLWSPDWAESGPPGDLAPALLEHAPRLALGREIVWIDARGLPASALAARLLERVAASRASGTEDEVHATAPAAGLAASGVRAGIAATPVAAEVAARTATSDAPVRVAPGGDREFLASLPIRLLQPNARLLALLDGVGVGTCGELAALDREAVEVRFGPDAVALWRLAHADDPRRLFTAIPPEHPHASLDFVDYVLTDPARLVFTANALLGSICDVLRAHGEHARRVTLSLALANGGGWRRTLRPARPTASRAVWLRLVRTELERLTVPDAVAGMRIEVDATEPAAVRQGDLFDRGFATAEAVEVAVARLIEAHGPVVVAPEVTPHPLAERRTRWMVREPADVSASVLPVSGAEHGGIGEGVEGAGSRVGRSVPVGEGASLSLQLLPEPRAITVETVTRRDHRIPVRYRDGRGRQDLVVAAGPDRVSGDRWGEAYAREYFRCVTTEGVLVWLFRDARQDAWYLHGWWD